MSEFAGEGTDDMSSILDRPQCVCCFGLGCGDPADAAMDPGTGSLIHKDEQRLLQEFMAPRSPVGSPPGACAGAFVPGANTHAATFVPGGRCALPTAACCCWLLPLLPHRCCC